MFRPKPKAWRCTVQEVANKLIEEHGLEAFWRAERFRRDSTLNRKEQMLSEDVFREVERRTRAARENINLNPRVWADSLGR